MIAREAQWLLGCEASAILNEPAHLNGDCVSSDFAEHASAVRRHDTDQYRSVILAHLSTGQPGIRKRALNGRAIDQSAFA